MVIYILGAIDVMMLWMHDADGGMMIVGGRQGHCVLHDKDLLANMQQTHRQSWGAQQSASMKKDVPMAIPRQGHDMQHDNPKM